MRILAPAALLVLAYLGGCMSGQGGNGSGGDAYEPKTIQMTLTVGGGLNMVQQLYVKNDNTTYSTAVAIPFLEEGQEESEGTVPGPTIEMNEGDTLVLTLINNNPLSHTFHLHGGLIPWESDGVDFLTQHPVAQGEEYTYTFPNMKAGTYWYHCHMDGAHHIDLGMYGAFIVKERNPPIKADRDYVILLDEYDNCHVHGNTDPVTNQQVTSNFQDSIQCYYRFVMDNLAQNQLVNNVGGTVNGTVQQPIGGADCPALITATESLPEPARTNIRTLSGCAPPHAHGTVPVYETPKAWWFENNPIYAPVYNTFLINGKAFPDTPVFPVKAGELVRFRIINVGNEMHFWHPHGHTMEVAYKDGYPMAGGAQSMDTLAIGPGERYDYFMRMNNPGLWMMHDQNGLAMTNDDKHPGGMMTCMPYDGFHDVDAFAMTRAIDCNYAALKILGEHHHDG